MCEQLLLQVSISKVTTFDALQMNDINYIRESKHMILSYFIEQRRGSVIQSTPNEYHLPLVEKSKLICY